MTYLKKLGLAAFLCLVSSASSALNIVYTITPGTFDDGASVSGNFQYDDVTGVISNIAVVTTAGPNHTANTFDVHNPNYAFPGEFVLLTNISGDMTGDPAMRILHGAPLGTLGSFAVQISDLFCAVSNCSLGNLPSRIAYTTFTGVAEPVPLQATLPLMFAGVVGVAAIVRRRKG